MEKPPFDPEAFMEAASALLGIEIDPAFRPGVIDNLRRSAAIAAPMLDFPLADDLEAATPFRP